MNDTFAPERRYLVRLQVVAWISICASAALLFFGNQRYGHEAIGAGFEDDFYYYAQTARNLALHGRSTFDGIHLTNGYHPLWFLLLTALYKLCSLGCVDPNTSALLSISLECVQVILVVVTAALTFRLLRLRCTIAVSCCIQLAIVSIVLVLVRTGMEVSLTLPIALGFLLFRLRSRFEWSSRSSLVYGLLASAMVLSRLDALLFVALLCFFDVAPLARARRSLVNVAWFSLGLFPIALYLAINRLAFGLFLPVSGAAKQMRAHHLPSSVAMHSFAKQLFSMKVPVYTLCFAGTLICMYLLALRRARIPDQQRGVIWAALLFPFVHFLAVVSLSDWSIWRWYLYAWPISGTIAAYVLLAAPEPVPEQGAGRWEYAFANVCCGLVFAYGILLTVKTDPANQMNYVAATELAAFAQTHKGTYAMGDRSGAVGYLLKDPLIQLEGLMMDGKYLENIRSQRDLVEVLRSYGVRYYISTRSEADAAGCYSFREPAEAGADSPTMRGRLCATPLLVLTHGSYPNHVFDLQSASTSPSAP